MPDEFIIEKAGTLERRLKRVSDIYAGNPKNLHEDLTKQDSILLNIQRACQASIDLAMRIIRVRSLNVPKESKDAFKVLEAAQLIPADLSISLQKMVGFRNIAIHEYQALNLKIVESVIQKNLNELLKFTELALKL